MGLIHLPAQTITQVLFLGANVFQYTAEVLHTKFPFHLTEYLKDMHSRLVLRKLIILLLTVFIKNIFKIN